MRLPAFHLHHRLSSAASTCFFPPPRSHFRSTPQAQWLESHPRRDSESLQSPLTLFILRPAFPDASSPAHPLSPKAHDRRHKELRSPVPPEHSNGVEKRSATSTRGHEPPKIFHTSLSNLSDPSSQVARTASGIPSKLLRSRWLFKSFAWWGPRTR